MPRVPDCARKGETWYGRTGMVAEIVEVAIDADNTTTLAAPVTTVVYRCKTSGILWARERGEFLMRFSKHLTAGTIEERNLDAWRRGETALVNPGPLPASAARPADAPVWVREGHGDRPEYTPFRPDRSTPPPHDPCDPDDAPPPDGDAYHAGTSGETVRWVRTESTTLAQQDTI